MSDYFPPSENLPIFDVSVFRSTNDNVITQEEADRLYLHRNGTASSLATSTSFLGPITTTGNLTLNGTVASNRQVEASFLKLVDNASVSTNKPLIWYPDPSLQITTNDPVGAVKTIDLKSFNGTGTGVSTSLACQYGQVQAQGTIRLTRSTDATRYSNITMGATELTIENTYTGSGPHINLNTPTAGAGKIITNCPISLEHPTDPLKRTITSSVNYFSEYTNASANKPSTLYNTNSLITTTNDVSPLQYMKFNSYDGTQTNKSTTFQMGYNEYIAQGAFYISQPTNISNKSSIVMGATDLTVTNPNLAGNIVITNFNPTSTGDILIRSGGKIKPYCPIEPQIGSNPTTIAQIGGTSITTATSLGLTSGAGYNSTSVTLTPGTYMLVGNIQYSLAAPSANNTFRSWGCGFDTTSASFNATLGTPYYASLNYIKSAVSTDSLIFSDLTSGPRMQTVMNINLTAASTIIYLNYVLLYSGTSTWDVFGSIMVTRIA